MPAQTVTSPGQKNTVSVPKTGATQQAQSQPKAGRSWWDEVISAYSGFYVEETLYNALLGEMSPDQVERLAKAHESDMLHAGATPMAAKVSANKVREDAKRDSFNPSSWAEALLPDFGDEFSGGIGGSGLGVKDVVIVGGALLAGYFLIKMVKG